MEQEKAASSIPNPKDYPILPTQFAQLVLGPPGSGKTTYCAGMLQFLNQLERKTAIINLDPANDILPYECAVDIAEIVSLEAVMKEMKLGPNGGMMYCLEYLEHNIDWLYEKIKGLEGYYLLIDCPGQVELYTHHDSMHRILMLFQRWNLRVAAVHLVDSLYCVEPAKYFSVLLLCLQTMLKLELPHVNVLTKIDLLKSYGKLPFRLDFYTDVMDLNYLLDRINEDTFGSRYKDLNKAIVDLVQDFSLVSFSTLNIQDKKSLSKLLTKIDKTNGFHYAQTNSGLEYYNEKYASDNGSDSLDSDSNDSNDSETEEV